LRDGEPGAELVDPLAEMNFFWTPQVRPQFVVGPDIPGPLRSDGLAYLNWLGSLIRYLLSERAKLLILGGNDIELVAHVRGRQRDALVDHLTKLRGHFHFRHLVLRHARRSHSYVSLAWLQWRRTARLCSCSSPPRPASPAKGTKMKPIVLSKRGLNPSTMPPRRSDLWRSHQNIRTFVEPANAAAFQ
jgi:hypothetical protein